MSWPNLQSKTLIFLIFNPSKQHTFNTFAHQTLFGNSVEFPYELNPLYNLENAVKARKYSCLDTICWTIACVSLCSYSQSRCSITLCPVFFAKSPSPRADWPLGLVLWAVALLFSQPKYILKKSSQFSLAASVASSGTSSPDEEASSTALQSNGNDCAPGETENCNVLEWSAVLSVRGRQRHTCNSQLPFWAKDVGIIMRGTTLPIFNTKIAAKVLLRWMKC